MKTRLILKEDIPGLGLTGDEVEVAPGYARNYLLPQGLALPWSEDAVRRIEKRRREAEARRAAMRQDMEALAERLAEVQLTFEEKASEEGRLYGSVTARRIADELSAQGFELSDGQVRLAEPIRTVGEYEVPIHLHAEVDSAIKVWVVSTEPVAAAETAEGEIEAESAEGADSAAAPDEAGA